MEANDRPEHVVDLKELGLLWAYSPAACKFLNFVVTKFSLPSEIFERQDDEDFIHDETTDLLWDEAYDNPVPFIEKQRQSLLVPGEEKLYAEYDILMQVIQESLRKRQRFGEYRKNDNNRLVKRFKVARDLGPNDQLKGFHTEWERLVQLPVMQEMISDHLHDERLELASLKAHLSELHEELTAAHQRGPGDGFVYKDTPLDQRRGHPPPEKPIDLNQYNWNTWDGNAVDDCSY